MAARPALCGHEQAGVSGVRCRERSTTGVSPVAFVPLSCGSRGSPGGVDLNPFRLVRNGTKNALGGNVGLHCVPGAGD
jgi:hypothetical protein